MVKQIFHILSKFNKGLKNDHVSAYAGQATLFIIISMFPFLMFLLSLIRYLPITQGNIMNIMDNILPGNITPMFIRFISEAYIKSSTTLISITAITALWSASRGFLSVVRGLNVVYGIKETRNYVKLRISSTLYTLAFALIIVITLLVLVFGNRLSLWIKSVFPVLKEATLIIMSLRAVVGLSILFIFFLILFLAIPDRKSTITGEIPGAIVAAAGWMVFSYLYSYYIDNMGNLSNTYGSLGAIVFLMLWLYFCMYILFIGAEINHVLASTSLEKYLSDLS